jgi:hypothetical protein
MAIIKADARQLRDKFPPENANRGDGRGKKRVIYDKVTRTSADTLGDIIEFGALDIPKGSRIHNVCLRVSGSGLPSAGSLEVGYIDPKGVVTADPDAFIDTLVLTAAGFKEMKDVPASAGFFLLASTDLRLTASFEADSTGATDLVIECSVEFSEE